MVIVVQRSLGNGNESGYAVLGYRKGSFAGAAAYFV